MSYKVLYRKYRPNNFNDIIDQKFITDTLKESIISNKISHAYIFSGPKGTGKTSTAKVFAKAINCENSINGEPCEKCDSCKNFDSNPDIIELDAASNNKVEDIREIINNVKLAPTNSKYKIYIIDEVHMLTNSAFNAFLLTLEEPPAHAIFILATTNPESLPATILSRCQHFAFSKISKKALIERIKYVLNEEKIKMDDSVINEIATLSDGGLRDALSILDQLVTLNKTIDADLLTEQFGVVSDNIINQLINGVIENDFKGIRKIFSQMKDYGINVKSFINKLVHLLTEKICDFKEEGKNYSKLKSIVLEISSLDNYKTNFSYYDVIEMIIISNLDKSLSISQEINEKIVSEKSNEETDVSSEGMQQNNDELEKKENNTNNLPKVNNNLIEVRINNSFVDASIKMKIQFETNYDKFVEKLKNDNDIYPLLLDTTVGVVSPTNVLLVTESEASAKLLNDSAESIKNRVKSEKKYVFVDKNKWNKLMEEYKNNLKSKISYKLMDEPVLKENNELENIANNIFDTDTIVMEEE